MLRGIIAIVILNASVMNFFAMSNASPLDSALNTADDE
jgi:hypothetical protein